MNARGLIAAAIVAITLAAAGGARAESVAKFPSGWESWPVHHTGAIPEGRGHTEGPTRGLPVDLPRL